MEIRFDCPRCGQNLAVEERGAGMQVNCPTCKGKIEIPRSTPAEAPKASVPVSTPPPLPPLPPPPEKKKRTETPASIGGACAFVAAFAPLLHPFLFFILSLPLLFAAFVLAIVSLVRGRAVGGICLLVGLFPASMMAFVTLTDRGKLLSRQHESGRKSSVWPTSVLQTAASVQSQAISTKQSQVAAVEETPSSPPQSRYPAKLPSANAAIGAADISPPHLVTTTQNISIGGDVLPAGTHLELLSKEGSEVHVRYKGVEYAIPISATGIK
jgi:DNA-directed RNA polymerase subunit RPC12/RpoP